MEGDILIVEEHHKKVAKQIVEMINDEINDTKGKFIITVAGESGSGKSETAASIASELEIRGIKCYIFQQDDYFVYPPKTNTEVREGDINWVGAKEVKIDLLDSHLKSIRQGDFEIVKPLVIFKDDKITEETVNIGEYKVIIAEGTYTTLLKNVNKHIFIDRDLHETLIARRKRNREKQDGFLEKVLTIEHNSDFWFDVGKPEQVKEVSIFLKKNNETLPPELFGS